MAEARKRILVVDDDPEIRDSLQVILESGGYEVQSAASGMEGLRCFKDQKPDLVLLDLMMEEIDSGTNLAQALHALGETVPIYILSSTGDSLNLATSCQDLGLTGILQKPIAPDRLLSLVAANFAKG